MDLSIGSRRLLIMEMNQTIENLEKALAETERAWRKERKLKQSWRRLAIKYRRIIDNTESY